MPAWSVRRLWDAVGRRVFGTLTHVATAQPLIALTFDDGPHPEYTPRLLDTLERHDARATFFMLGEMAQRYPEIVRRAAQAGHDLGNHTWDHPSLPYLPAGERRAQLQRTDAALNPYGKRFFRPPYGHQNLASRVQAGQLGYAVVTWSCHAFDWLDHPAEWMAKELIRQLAPGSIALLHDALYHTVEERYADRGPTLAAVDQALAQLTGRYRFVPVSELLRHGQPVYANWYRQGDPAWLNTLNGSARRYAPGRS
jgi:peptidoglycan/xylan/chitin deacetylase (PgdA/CDA1 family)